MTELEALEQEVLGSLEGSPVVERTITPEDARIFQVRAELAILNIPGWDFEATELFLDPNPTPIYNGENEQIGTAAVSIQGRKLVADMFLRYDSPERLTIEAAAEKVWARPIGSYFGTRDAPWHELESEGIQDEILDFADDRHFVEEIEITGILLTTAWPPRDARIEPVGKPVA